MWTDQQGEQPHDLAREMTIADISTAIAECTCAIEAGFDGVELHGANGYLISQVLDPGSNQRDDAFGGDPLRRNRFALDVAAAAARAIGAARTGIRLSP
jgi:N-ethylmaleimide reductase